MKQLRMILIIVVTVLICGVIIYFCGSTETEDVSEPVFITESVQSQVKATDKDDDKQIATETDAGIAATTVTDAELQEATEEEFSFDIEMTFVGDCLMASNYNDTSQESLLGYAASYPDTYFFEKVIQYFDDDLTVANCENVFSDRDLTRRDKGTNNATTEATTQVGTDTDAEEEPVIEQYWFKAPTAFASVFTDNSIEAVTIDNNHTYDYGYEGLMDTQAALDAAGVMWGYRDKILYYEKEGYTVAIICCSFYSQPEAEIYKTYIQTASESSDFQIVYFHGGTEAIEQPEDWKIAACHGLVDAGADLVIGAHPHVLQYRENYNGVDIVYSLGNFCFGGNNHPRINRTIIYKYTLHIGGSEDEPVLEDKTEEMIPCYVYTGDRNNWQPAPIEDEELAAKVIAFMNGEISSLQ